MAVLLSTALVSVVKNVVSRGHSTYPVVDNIGDTFVEITSRVDTGVLYYFDQVFMSRVTSANELNTWDIITGHSHF